MSTLLQNIGEVLASVVNWVGKLAGCIMDTPMLLVPFVLGMAFTAIGLFKSLR